MNRVVARYDLFHVKLGQLEVFNVLIGISFVVTSNYTAMPICGKYLPAFYEVVGMY